MALNSLRSPGRPRTRGDPPASVSSVLGWLASVRHHARLTDSISSSARPGARPGPPAALVPRGVRRGVPAWLSLRVIWSWSRCSPHPGEARALRAATRGRHSPSEGSGNWRVPRCPARSSSSRDPGGLRALRPRWRVPSPAPPHVPPAAGLCRNFTLRPGALMLKLTKKIV